MKKYEKIRNPCVPVDRLQLSDSSLFISGSFLIWILEDGPASKSLDSPTRGA
jgi:hypothetical protein